MSLEQSGLGVGLRFRANGYPAHNLPVESAPGRYRILGPVEVCHGGRWTSLRQAKCRALLAVLLINANQVVPAAALRQQLWCSSAPRTAGKLLQHYVYLVRRTLGDPDGQRLRTQQPGYRLTVGNDELDADRFTARAAHAQRVLAAGYVEAAARDLRHALDLWRGPALGDVQDVPAAVAEANHLEEFRLTAMETWVEAELACGRHTWLIPPVETLVAAHPLRERLRVQLMLALYRCGRQADALAQFLDLRRTLGDELGLEPSAAAQQMHLAILRGDADLRRSSTSPAAFAAAG